MNKKIIKRIYNVVVVLFLVGAVAWCFSHFVHGVDVEYTDDAQVCRHITPINTRVPGFIKEIRFTDFQHVHKGDTLVIIEDAEFRLQVAQAEAGLRGSKSGSSVVTASMGTTVSNVQTASAGIEEARVDMLNAKKDFDRFAALMKKDAVTRQQYDNAYARYLGAKARYEQANSRRQSAASVRNVQTHQLGSSRAGESVAEAQLNLARLNLSYTVIVATCDGVMGRKDIHVGQLVQPGQMLARIVDDHDVWVVANYRETQMDGIEVGKTVEFTADAIPGVVFHGKVEALSAAAGSAYSMIPVDNATGNFVKVEQRVPVRIALDKDNDPKQVALLRAGLNVETKVNDATKVSFEEESFDRILCDVPCSGLGDLSHKPEIRYHLKPENIDEIIHTQKKILEVSSLYLKKGGILVYSTCTLNKKENSGQIKNFLKEHPEFTCVEERTVFPFEEHYDGFYIAKLTKNQE